MLLPTIFKSSRHAYIKDQVVTLVLASRLSVFEVLHNNCNMGTLSLPEMYLCILGLHSQTLHWEYILGFWSN